MKRNGRADEVGPPRLTSSRWVLLTSLLLLLSAPFLLDLNLPGIRCYRGKYRAPRALTGTRLPNTAAIVSIGRQGIIRVSPGDEMSLPLASDDELLRFTDYIVSSYPDRPFVLKIDKDISYARVDMVLSTLKQARVKDVYFHTELPG